MKRIWKRLRFVIKIRRFFPFLIEFFRSQEVSMLKKTLVILLLASYAAFPFDIIPDWLGLFGVIDDVAVLLFILQQIVKMAPSRLKNKYGL
ncbi:YkvA family protein [Parageobacillus thermoglucosidasius]|uniref:DUF1232 domain-containing protein n=3 Tax=Anoxybacillaceae TaxID=3120669 RepID=A0AAN0YM75_PARTM|nr:DUF1232 domain-containing protein [Parageobacillus thermoglucosidasius]KYD15682.1 hypothetical protein B4168_3142 [Anoxybacillus flavithermus]REK57661.1 MAG: DUF1232 domain-containing protein [Geobacillus sp.]AEH49097.1 protein of unknown function DUF1232 [Parageobacillus thermoglucosidasius C56-YS93]ALF09670.1 hypothetical protein AOT13_06510 [Parageobacillus thermoglucosidasius]ANZ29750.1 hypothetical protein BCV53_06515 [Parageobacillus thermoglucosidasius]